jgi:putative ABC transport system permease protein
LTALGVIIGVGAVVALTSLGTGFKNSVTQRFANLGTNLLTVGSGQGGRGGPPGLVRLGGQQTITLEDALAIRNLGSDKVVGVAPTVQRNLQAKFAALNNSATVIGTWPEYASVRNSPVQSGAWFSEADVQGRKRVAVIGYDIKTNLFDQADPLGQKIKLSGISFTVVGVLPDKGNSGFGNPNQNIFVPLSTYQQRLGNSFSSSGVATVQAVNVQGADPAKLSELKDQISDLLAVRHKKEDPSEYDFNITNQADTIASFTQTLNLITIFLGGVAAISLLVGGIGIMNIMLVSVTERTREIGIRKALGAKPRDIMTQFLVESFVLSVGGGVLGILLGMGLAQLGQRFNIAPAFSPSGILAAFAFAAAVGIFFGLYPAGRAAKLDPVESLRYE